MTTYSSSTITESISITLNEAVGSATISPSGRDVCLAARNGLFIVDLDDPWATPRFLPYYSAIVSDVQWSPHPARAHWVVSTSGNKGLVWNLAASSANGSSPIEHVTLGHERSITDINWAVFQPDTLATCGIDGNVLAYDLRQGGKKPTLQYCGWRHGATQVKYNRQNPNELASSHGEWLYIWDDRKGSHPVTTIRAHEQKIYGIDYSRKRKDSIVTCSLDHTVKYWTLDGLETIAEPDQVINTMSPVWRARHTPFGNGIVTLPQRSEYSVKIWAQDAPNKEVWKLSGHTDVVREFLWRTQGGNDANDDDRLFQLVTWGSDQQLLLTPLPPDVLASVGHVPHSPIEVRQTRRNAPNISFREPTTLPKSNSFPQSNLPGSSSLGHGGPGVSPTNHLSAHPSSASAGGETSYSRSTMTPLSMYSMQDTSVTYGHHRQPLTATSRYGRSANSNTSTSSADGRSPSLGTSPADSRGLYLTDRRLRQGPSSASADNDRILAQLAQEAKPGNGAFMTRATGRKPGGQDAVSWMEGVRVVSASQQATQTTANMPDASRNSKLAVFSGDIDGVHDDSQPTDKDVVPLHEELTAIARALQNKVRFEKIAIPTRTLIVALYGPWAASGISTFLRATFTFPSDYPRSPLNLEIERSSSVTNKMRAKILAGVRSLAARYANRSKNSLEACLDLLMLGKATGPEEAIEGEDHDAAHTELSHFLVHGLDDGDAEADEADSEEDIERLLANRNCPMPRRAGAVFTPSGHLFAFFPLDSVQAHQAHPDKRGRSQSPSLDRSRPRRRRLFESFGVIPALQMKSAEDLEEADELFQHGQDEDSDEILNIPSLLLARRQGQSHAGSDSVGTSHHLNIRLAGTGRVFNSRIYRHDYCGLIGTDTALAQEYTLQGNLLSIITANTETVVRRECSWLVQRAWKSLLGLAEASTASSVKGMPIRALFLGESMPEKVFMDILDIFFRLGDVQMTGLLACLVELDRRTIQESRPLHARRLSRSPGVHGAVDYFSLKPVRGSRPITGPISGHLDHRQAMITPTSSGLPLKSPKDWIASTSYGTQGSSTGSSARGSSWANNLSTFFKSSATAGEKSGFSRMGRSTSPSGGLSGHPSPASLSPAFVKRSTIAPLSEVRKQGGIASGRPATPIGRSKTTPHVSFAAASQPESQRMSERNSTKSTTGKSGVRFVIQRHDSKPFSQAPSMLLHPQVQAQLEYYRILYADLLHRLQLPHRRAQVLKLTRSVLDGTNKSILQMASGLDSGPGSALVLEQTCPTCGRVLVGRAPAYCSHCRKKRDAAPCAVCHLPLRGLVETCLSCLHTCHLSCLEEWRIDEVLCPAACGCSCTEFAADDAVSESFTETFKSPPIVT